MDSCIVIVKLRAVQGHVKIAAAAFSLESQTRWVVRSSAPWLSFIEAECSLTEPALFSAVQHGDMFGWFTIIEKLGGRIVYLLQSPIRCARFLSKFCLCSLLIQHEGKVTNGRFCDLNKFYSRFLIDKLYWKTSAILFFSGVFCFISPRVFV